MECLAPPEDNMGHHRLIARCVNTLAVPALLLGSAACTGVVDPVLPHSPAISAVISPNLDLDATEQLLHYKNTYGVINDVIPPWGSAVSVYAADNVRFDHATADGWVVVYNMFDVGQTNSRPVLALYNKYRGLLRWWWWNDQDPAAASNYLTYALSIDGNNTSALNFTGEFAKASNAQSLHPFFVTGNSATFNQGLANHTWYYFDMPIAYDPAIAGQPQASYSFVVNGWATSVAKLTLEGDINGTINGTITGSGSGITLLGSAIGSITQTSYKNSTTVISNGPSAKVSLTDKINTAISSGLADAIKSNLNTLATQGLNVIGSPLSNLFGSLLSSAPSPQQRVSLNLAAKITANGELKTETAAITFRGALPGTARGDLSGYVPFYNETLGAFSLSAPPIVKWRVVTGLYPLPGPGQKDIQYTAVAPTVVVNPAIAGEVTLSPVSASLIYIRDYSGSEPLYNYNYLANPSFSGWTPVNSLFGNAWFSFTQPYAIRYNSWSGTPEDRIVVKVSFTITPKNGAPPVEVVQIYRPTFVNG